MIMVPWQEKSRRVVDRRRSMPADTVCQIDTRAGIHHRAAPTLPAVTQSTLNPLDNLVGAFAILGEVIITTNQKGL